VGVLRVTVKEALGKANPRDSYDWVIRLRLKKEVPDLAAVSVVLGIEKFVFSQTISKSCALF
jgi:hypothetical protein